MSEINQQRMVNIISELYEIENKISDGYKKYVICPEDVIKIISQIFIDILEQNDDISKKIELIIITMMDFKMFLSNDYSLYVGKYGVYNTLHDFAIRIMIT